MAFFSTRFFIAAALLAASACDSGGGNDPQCNALCDRTPTATPVQGGCVSDYVEARGYDTDHPDCVRLANAFVSGSATAAMCRACYGAIGVSGADCAGAESACFGSPMPDSGPAMDSGPGDTGPGDTGPGDDVGPADTGPADTGPGDDVGPADTGPGDDAGEVATCNQLCDLTPGASGTQGGCSSDLVDTLGYDTDNVPCGLLAAAFAAGSATAAQCNACYSAIAITDTDCQAVHTSCF